MRPQHYEESDSSYSVAIINYNGASYLPDTLTAIAAACSDAEDVFLVDNQSTDQSIALVERENQDAKILRMPSNDGPGPARNRAIHAANSRYLLVVDNDVSPAPCCLETLRSALVADPEACLAMPAILYANKPSEIQFAGAEAHFMGTVAPLAANRSKESISPDPTRCTSLISAAFLVDRSKLGSHILFDEHLFIYQEDHEAGLRANVSGLKTIVAPAATCLHRDGSIGLSIRQTGEVSARRIQQNIYNRWYLMLTNYQLRSLIRYLPALFVYEIAQIGGALAKGWLGHWAWAFRRIVKNRKTIQTRRGLNRSQRTLPDAAVLRGGPFPFNRETKHSALQRFVETLIDLACSLNWFVAGPRGNSGDGGKNRPNGSGSTHSNV